jgi:hypothetical protein
VNWPVPQPGLVVRYAYLWESEAREGRKEGVKDRPCAIVLVVRDQDDEQRVQVLPVTHSPPPDSSTAVEIPAAVKARLGLDSERSWIVVTELNEFIWPGPDLRPAVSGDLASAAYGFLPPRLFRAVRDRYLALHAARRIKFVHRTE